ncbi:MAG TPA: hypothetical protein VGQ57_16790, partial [Polyangiaceae bacterium]|nr:hypothetical protein [Polyangiaceae bacterium]
VASPDGDDGGRVSRALVTGIGIAGASLAYGGAMLTVDRTLASKHSGLAVMHTGLALAPLMAHGVVDEWWRGAAFSIAPALGGLGMAALLAERPDAPIKGKQKSQKIYPVLITVSVLGSAVGIFDAALCDQRLPAVNVAVGRDFAGAEVTGSF